MNKRKNLDLYALIAGLWFTLIISLFLYIIKVDHYDIMGWSFMAQIWTLIILCVLIIRLENKKGGE
jgi:hypothetical protein